MFSPFTYDSTDYMLHHSVTQNPKDSDFPMHAHHRCELYCFLSGNGFFSVEGCDYPLAPGHFLLLRAGEAHKLHIQPDIPYERFALHFPTAELDRPALSCLRQRYTERHLGQNNLLLPDDTTLGFVKSCMERISNLSPEDPTREEKIQIYLQTVFLELERAVRGQSENDLPVSETTGDAGLVGQLAAYINAHLLELRGLEELEEVFFFSSSYLNRVFRKSTGSSIWDYVILKRLLCARSLLRDGKSVALAAAESGFSDYSSFFRQYKRRFGTTPIQARTHSEG